MIQMEDMVEEATKRLEILQKMGMDSNVIKLWKEENEVTLSSKIAGKSHIETHLKLSTVEELNSIKNQIEKKFGCLVYYAIYSNTKNGGILSVLYVSAIKKDWLAESNNLTDGYTMAYAWNLDRQRFSAGEIAVKIKDDVLIRIA